MWNYKNHSIQEPITKKNPSNWGPDNRGLAEDGKYFSIFIQNYSTYINIKMYIPFNILKFGLSYSTFDSESM